jgi:hypothetical protein
MTSRTLRKMSTTPVLKTFTTSPISYQLYLR